MHYLSMLAEVCSEQAMSRHQRARAGPCADSQLAFVNFACHPSWTLDNAYLNSTTLIYVSVHLSIHLLHRWCSLRAVHPNLSSFFALSVAPDGRSAAPFSFFFSRGTVPLLAFTSAIVRR